MRESIKKRIEAVRHGEVPEGYRRTKDLGIAPSDWRVGQLSDVLHNEQRPVPKPDEPYWRLGIRSWAKGTFHAYVDDPAAVDMDELYVVQENDLVVNITFAWEHAIAVASKEDDGLLVSHRFPTYVFDDGNVPAYYRAVVSQRFFKDMLDHISPGGAGRNRVLNRKDFLALPCYIPSIAEQQKIAEILATCDRVIELKQCKIDELNKLKQTYLRKMFPQKGKTVPEIRFPDFSDPWEQRKLGDVCQITMGQSPDGDTYSDVPSDYILVQGNADLKNGWVCPRIWTTQKIKTAEAGDLIMSVRAPAGAMGKTNYNVVLGRGVAGIKGNEFIFQTLVKMYEDGYWKKLAAGSTFESINSDVISNAEIAVPQDVAEQEKLGAYFRNLDNLITLHQRELEEYGKYKKALMQLLLTGLVRVNA